MKKAGLVVLAVVAAAAAFLAGTRFQRSGGEAGSSGSAGARKILYWHDPMHPAYRSDRSGIAPDCGMQLEPVYADGAPAAAAESAPRPAGSVSIALDKQQLLGVRVGAVDRAASTQTLRLFGRVAPEESRMWVLNAALEGSVREVSGVTTGSRVRKGQLLARVFSADSRAPLQAYITALDVQDQDPLARRQAGVVVAAGSTASSSALFTIERLHGIGFSDGQLEEIRRTRKIPLTIDLLAPADGFVLARNVTPGQKFERGAEWYRIANLDKVWILADVFEGEAAHVRPGMRAQVTVPGQRKALVATVSEVLPQFDPAARALKIRLEADNPGYVLRPEMFVDVGLRIDLPEAATIPPDAVVDSGLRKTVFVDRGDGWFEPRAIETGWRFGDRVEVVKGLAPGERVVVSGTFLVDSESRMKAAAAGISSAAVKDPVCGMDVDEAKARAAGKVVERGGKTFFFCSDQCKSRFESSPDRFANDLPEHAHVD
jgi:membrane fusion protein, copper/silver efflux system